MKPTRVPDDLIEAGSDAIRAWYAAHPSPNSYLDDRTQMRIVLAAALTLHDQHAEQRLRPEYGQAMSDERIEHIGILLSAPDVGGVAQVIARELLAELKQARAQLAEIGETRQEFGVRTYDNDEDVEIMSSQEQAREIAEAWRHEIPGSNPTVMVRTRQSKPGEWREVPNA